jgi:hypothetical protein
VADAVQRARRDARALAGAAARTLRDRPLEGLALDARDSSAAARIFVWTFSRTPSSSRSRYIAVAARRFAWVSMQPFGGPVVPEV